MFNRSTNPMRIDSARNPDATPSFLATFRRGAAPRGPRGSRSSGAFSLVEILVGSTVALLLLGVIADLLVNSTRVSVKGANQVELQQRAMLVGDRLANDLRSSTGGGVGVLPDGADKTYVTIHPRKPDVGQVAWQPKIIVYAWAKPDLTVFYYELSPAPSDATRPPLGTLNGLSDSVKKVTQKVAGVTMFDFVVEAGPLAKYNITFEKDGQSTNLQRVILLRQGS